MFDYSYWPEQLHVELNLQIRNFNHKAQLIVDGLTFLELGNSILKAQMGDKFFELIVFLPRGFRTIEAANLLHRLVQGGAKVGIFEVEIVDQEFEQFAIFDSKLLISNRLHEVEKSVFQLILKKHNDFERIMEGSQPVSASSQEIKMKFWANRYFVAKGEEVELAWNIENANSTLLNPGNFEIESVGNTKLLIEKDMLFTITSRNAKKRSTLSIFIKCIEQESFVVSVSVFNRELSAYVKIDPISQEEESFAVYKGDLIRVEWACKSAVSLTEHVLGKLKNIGYHNFIALENKEFEFDVTLTNGSFRKQLKIYPFTAQGTISNSSAEAHSTPAIPHPKPTQLPKRKLFSWINKVFGVLKNKGKNGIY
jgi:CRISPR/Cas system-associated endoribonuclease Cas2